MKCVCGYQHEKGIDENGEWKEFLVGDERFERLNLVDENDGFATKPLKVEAFNVNYFLFRCPKCGTVRTETSDWN